MKSVMVSLILLKLWSIWNAPLAFSIPRSLIIRSQSQDRLIVSNPPESKFRLCPKSKGLSLRNAAWFSYLSANQYSHFGKLSTSLSDVGLVDSQLANRYAKRALIIQGEKARLKLLPPKPGSMDLDPMEMDWQKIRQEYEDVIPLTEDDEKLRAALLAVTEIDPDAPKEDRENALNRYKARFLFDILEEDLQFFSAKLKDEGKNAAQGITQAMWVKVPQESTVIISFRGTENDEFHEIAADLSVNQRTLDWEGFESAKVHSGFLKAFEEIDSLLLEKIKSLDPDTKIYITGHSLGGAIGSLLLAKLISLNMADLVEGLYLFGSPRVGNKSFVNLINEFSKARNIPLLHLSIEGDPVSTLRVPFMETEYFHFGTHILFKETPEVSFEILESGYDPDKVNFFNLTKPHQIQSIHTILRNIALENQEPCSIDFENDVFPLIEEKEVEEPIFGDGF